MDIFNPDCFCQPCCIIGVGAIGSRLAENLARLGIKRLELYDGDTVKSHNIPTGAFLPNSMGTHKVDAMEKQLSLVFPKIKIFAYRQMVKEAIKFRGIVFLCVDSMAARREIWKNCIKHNPAVPLMVEIRIGPRHGIIYTVNPLDLKEIECWEQASAYGDGYNEQLPCTLRAVITTVNITVGLAVDQLIKWHSQQWLANCMVVGLQDRPVLVADRWT